MREQNSRTAATEHLDFAMADSRSLAEIQALLASNELPCSDVEKHLDHFLIARCNDEIVGSVGIEIHGRDGLLRSVCVAPQFRNRHLGSELCDLIEAYARNVGVSQLYLLTTTAILFFARRGFTAAARDTVPPAIKQTKEFRSLCPDSATCMTKRLADGALHLSTPLLPLREDVPGARMWAAGLKNTMLTYFEVEPNTRFEIHLHEGEQITSVVAGELFFELDSRTIRVGPGEVMAIPPGVKHGVFTRDLAAKAFDAWSPPPSRYQVRS